VRVFRNRCSRKVDNDQSVGTVGDIGSLTNFRTISGRGATAIKANGITSSYESSRSGSKGVWYPESRRTGNRNFPRTSI
jgi:hypothetical protein